MWKSIYVIGRINNFRFIIRNQWHEYTNTGFYIIQIGKETYMDRSEFIFNIIGFQLVIRKSEQ